MGIIFELSRRSPFRVDPRAPVAWPVPRAGEFVLEETDAALGMLPQLPRDPAGAGNLLAGRTTPHFAVLACREDVRDWMAGEGLRFATEPAACP